MMYMAQGIAMQTVFGDGSAQDQSGGLFDKMLGAGKRSSQERACSSLCSPIRGRAKGPGWALAAPYSGARSFLLGTSNRYQGRRSILAKKPEVSLLGCAGPKAVGPFGLLGFPKAVIGPWASFGRRRDFSLAGLLLGRMGPWAFGSTALGRGHPHFVARKNQGFNCGPRRRRPIGGVGIYPGFGPFGLGAPLEPPVERLEPFIGIFGRFWVGDIGPPSFGPNSFLGRGKEEFPFPFLGLSLPKRGPLGANCSGVGQKALRSFFFPGLWARGVFSRREGPQHPGGVPTTGAKGPFGLWGGPWGQIFLRAG